MVQKNDVIQLEEVLCQVRIVNKTKSMPHFLKRDGFGDDQ